MRCSNATEGCLNDSAALYQCSCSEDCACAVCKDCLIVEGERQYCKICKEQDDLEKHTWEPPR